MKYREFLQAARPRHHQRCHGGIEPLLSVCHGTPSIEQRLHVNVARSIAPGMMIGRGSVPVWAVRHFKGIRFQRSLHKHPFGPYDLIFL
jgi:hypothetical protein